MFLPLPLPVTKSFTQGFANQGYAGFDLCLLEMLTSLKERSLTQAATGNHSQMDTELKGCFVKGCRGGGAVRNKGEPWNQQPRELSALLNLKGRKRQN